MERKKVVIAGGPGSFPVPGRGVFRRRDFDLLTAGNGRDALKIIRRERPDLIVLDLDLPEMDGDTCCRKVKADPFLQGTPVILLAPPGREADMLRCREAGCDEIVLKPADRHQISAVARRFLFLSARTACRYQARLPVRFGLSPENFLAGHSRNLSTGGILIETADFFPIDTRIGLEIDLVGRPGPLRCRGRVAWVNRGGRSALRTFPDEMGVQFLDLPAVDKTAIRGYIESEGLCPVS